MPYKNPTKKKTYNAEYQKKWNAKNPELVKEIQRRYYQKDPEKRKQQMADARERKRMKIATRPRSPYCEVCGLVCRTVLDHDHKTGKFRGWLCPHCNSALGHAKDSPPILEALARYIMRDYVLENLIRPYPEIYQKFLKEFNNKYK